MRRTLVLATLFTSACATAPTGDGIITTPGTPTTTRVLTDAGNFSVQSNADQRVSSQWVRAPMERVQVALPAVYESLGIPMTSSEDGRALRFANDGMVVNRRLGGERVSQYLDCGSTPIGTSMADASTVQLRMVTVVRGGENGTELRTQVLATAYSRAGGSGSGVGAPCRSTGKLEERIAQMVTERATS
ncbi:MAG TPA: hypothetical protein VF613_09415 [Longimicrobium sp.]